MIHVGNLHYGYLLLMRLLLKKKCMMVPVQQMVPVGSCLQLKMIRKLVVHCG